MVIKFFHPDKQSYQKKQCERNNYPQGDGYIEGNAEIVVALKRKKTPTKKSFRKKRILD
jgi:hypothetical protein